MSLCFLRLQCGLKFPLLKTFFQEATCRLKKVIQYSFIQRTLFQLIYCLDLILKSVFEHCSRAFLSVLSEKQYSKSCLCFNEIFGNVSINYIFQKIKSFPSPQRNTYIVISINREAYYRQNLKTFLNFCTLLTKDSSFS